MLTLIPTDRQTDRPTDRQGHSVSKNHDIFFNDLHIGRQFWV